MKAFFKYDEYKHIFTLCLDVRNINMEINDLSEEAAKYLIEELSESFKSKVKLRRILDKTPIVDEEDLQPVCQNNFYDFDTGECHHSAGNHQCSEYPHCQLKVGTPIIRSSASTVRN